MVCHGKIDEYSKFTRRLNPALISKFGHSLIQTFTTLLQLDIWCKGGMARTDGIMPSDHLLNLTFHTWKLEGLSE